MGTLKLSDLVRAGLALSEKTPADLSALADLLDAIDGRPAPPPRHPVTGEQLAFPLSRDDMAAVNHAHLARLEGGIERLRELACDCSFCVTLDSRPKAPADEAAEEPQRRD